MLTLIVLFFDDKDDECDDDANADGNDNGHRNDHANGDANVNGDRDDDDPDDDGNGDVPSPISPASGQQRVAWACKELLTNALLTNTISTLLYINTQA